MPKPSRSPQEKKAVSYERDRRNTYGENSKSSRKNIRKSKALERRTERRTSKQTVVAADRATAPEIADGMQTAATKKYRRRFKKLADAPLGVVVKKKLARRVRRHGAKGKRRAERAERPK